MRNRNRRVALAAAVSLVLLAAVFAALRVSSHGQVSRIGSKPLEFETQGSDLNTGSESNDYLEASQEFAAERTAPYGLVAPGAYSSAVSALNAVSGTGGSWTDITARKYDADSIHYRDYYSNSGGGSGFVTGRITGLAADTAGHIYAAGANGGVWRRLDSSPAGHWEAISDQLPSLSSGDLELGPDGSLWYATGEANTGGTSYVGAGVYRLTNPTTGQFTPSMRVGGDELESSTIGKIRFSSDGTTAWAATLRGLWYMPLNKDGSPAALHWTLSYAPNPQDLPSDLQQYTVPGSALASATFGTSTGSDTNAPYKNIVNDVAVDPKNSKHVVAAVAWRSGDSYNGFYESNDAGKSWTKINPTGAIPANDIGYVTFAYSKSGDKLYAINQSPTLLNKATGTVNSYLDGIYVSNNGSPSGPWSKIADQQKLANSGSALKQSVGGKGYGPGIQAWYNQLLAVDPSNSSHVYAGLEEVYETPNGGSNWNTVGPYWNFLFPCWRLDSTYDSENNTYNTCPNTTHADQHSIAIGGSGSSSFVVVGNDGGVFIRPLNGHVDSQGHATDWRSLNDGSIDTLQYYSVGVGKINATPHTITSTRSDNGAVVDETKLDQVGGTSGVLVSGGLQDNGGSLLNPDAGNMVSNFGGDGGDVLVDPNDGCNIVQEYVYLSMRMTRTCGSPDLTSRPNAFVDLSQSTEINIGPPDINARFTAPFVANKSNIDEWLAGGNSLWVQEKGFDITNGKDWTKAAGSTLASPGQVYTALAMRGNTAVAGWCGTCNNQGFTRGIVLGTHTPNTDASGWTFAQLPTTGLPNRYVGGVAIGPNGEIYAGMNGFSRRFTEGPGTTDVSGHIFKWDATSKSWVNVDGGNFPDIPVNSVQALDNGALLAGTDLGVLYRAPGATTWQRLGPTGQAVAGQLPLTTVMDVEVGPDNQVYAATHGRGIWRIPLPTG